MDLHRTDKVPEWELVEPKKRTFFQRLAARTRGIVTPANAATVGGTGLFLNGLYDFAQNNRGIGMLKMTGGALTDFVDGKLANFFKTKSPLGEALDASLDKVKMLAAVVVFGVTEVVPIVPLVAVTVQNTANIVLTGIAKARENEIHPESANKLTPWAQGLGLGAFAVASMFEPGVAQNTAEIAGYIGTVGGSLTVGGIGTKHLYDYAFNPQQREEAA